MTDYLPWQKKKFSLNLSPPPLVKHVTVWTNHFCRQFIAESVGYRIQFYTITVVLVIVPVTMQLGINSTCKAIEIVLGECYFNCFMSARKAIFWHNLKMWFLAWIPANHKKHLPLEPTHTESSSYTTVCIALKSTTFTLFVAKVVHLNAFRLASNTPFL